MERIAITGAAGFIGYNIFLKLKEKYPLAKIDFVDYKIANLASDRDFIRDKYSLVDPFFFLPKANTYDLIFHFGAKSKPKEHPDKIKVWNSSYTSKLISNLQLDESRKTLLVFASSAGVYGLSENQSDYQELKDLEPITHYGNSKLQSEKDLKSTDLNYFCVRPFNIFGNFEEHKIKHNISSPMTKFRDLCSKRQDIIIFKSEKEISRDFYHVEDLCDTILNLILTHSYTRGESYNLGSGDPHSFLEVARIIAKEYPKRKIMQTMPPSPDFFESYQYKTCAELEKIKSTRCYVDDKTREFFNCG